MVFVAAGMALAPDRAGPLELSLDSEVVLTLTEVTLAASLFADASTVPLRAVEGDAGVPGQLLGVGLLLTIIAGTVLGLVVAPELGRAGAALVVRAARDRGVERHRRRPAAAGDRDLDDPALGDPARS
jgi:NhaP-type Na+/H+ or K+/H+ antiporter